MREQKYRRSYILFLAAIALYIYSPFTALPSMYGMVGDTAIQIKLGLDGLSSGHMILDEIYSWHPNLIFTSHESGWYLLLGSMYKALGIAGVILVGTLFVYGTVALIINYLREHKVNPLICALVLVVVPFMTGFPDYNVRPSVSSTFALVLLVVTMFSSVKASTKSIVYVLISFVLGWLHGGILPVIALVMAVFAVIEILYKHPREFVTYLVAIVLGFVASLLNPIGIRVWTFGLKQTGATDIWALVGEWQPHVFTILEAVLILILFIGFMVDIRVKKFDKAAVTRVALLSMFFIATCLYTRFIMQFTVLYMLFAPEELSLLISWLNENLFKVKKPVDFSDSFYMILSLACVALVAYTAFADIPKYFKTNTMTDIEEMAAYDYGAIDYIKNSGYERVFNSFNTGSWLAFYDVPVHIDNRIDPYMTEYSGVDHIRGKMGIDNLSDLDAFMSEYDVDAFLIDTAPGYSPLLYEIEEYASDRYQIVYDETRVSNITDSISVRWVIIEPVS